MEPSVQEGHKNAPRRGTPPPGQAETAGAVQPGEGKASERPDEQPAFQYLVGGIGKLGAGTSAGSVVIGQGETGSS